MLCRVANNHLQESRFGFVVSKKISNKATVRNKVKRRLRDAVSGVLKGIKKPVDVIIIALSGIETREFSEIQETITNIFKKVKLL